MRIRFATTILLALVLMAVTGCSSTDDLTSGDGLASVQVLLTDKPSDYIAAAEVTISSVQLRPGNEENGAVELLAPEEVPQMFDLLQLQDGVTAFLADRMVPAGTYNQLRLIVDDANVTLIDGYQFTDGTTTQTLFVPSGMQSGIKVKTSEAIEAEEGTVTVSVVDFDVNESFVIQGDPEDPAGIQGILFTPVLREISRTEESM